MRVLLVQNSPVEDFAAYRVVLEEAGHRCRVLHGDAGDVLPSPDGWDLVLVGGTPVSARAFDTHPVFSKEWTWLGRALAEGVPCFGVCCGAQVLARLLGAETKSLAALEIGTFEARLTEDGAKDPLFSGFPAAFPVFQWHRDLFELPRGARALVSSDSWPVQAFRKDRVAGVLFHLELAPRDVLRWTKAYPEELAEATVSAGRVMGDVYAKAATQKALAARLVENLVLVASGRA